MIDLFGFGYGLNPAIAVEDDRPVPAVIAYLRREVPPPARILALGAELPPNVFMRYGLADLRNYDSIELSRSLDWFAPLYEPGAANTSRRDITWEGVRRAQERLRASGVAAIVAPTPPPPGVFRRVDRIDDLWIARLEISMLDRSVNEPGYLVIKIPENHKDRIVVAETFDPGWRAEVDGRRAGVEPHQGVFLSVPVDAIARRLVLRYDPRNVRAGMAVSLAALGVVGLLLIGWPIPRPDRKIALRSWKAPRKRGKIVPVTSSPVPDLPAIH